MAAKLKLMQFLQEARALAEITTRRPIPRSPMLYLIQLRSHVHEITIPKRRVVVAAHPDTDLEPQPVTISFAKPAETTCADTLVH